MWLSGSRFVRFILYFNHPAGAITADELAGLQPDPTGLSPVPSPL